MAQILLSTSPAARPARCTPSSATDVVVVFASRAANLARRFASLAKKLDPSGGLWVAYPKKSSSIATDVTFDIVQRTGLDAGLVDNKICAIDDGWTAMRFVYRLKDRR